MKKYKSIKYITLLFALGWIMVACEDFLNRPNQDGYNLDTFYQTDEQCIQAVNPLYSSPWYDFQRGFFKVGEVTAGNYYWGGSPYMSFNYSNDDADLNNMSASLWSVNAYVNGIIENINLKSGPDVSEAVKQKVKGEALVWKAMTYFYLVRIFGEVPIIHNNGALIASGDYNQLNKATVPNIYDYIILTLNQAIEWLPEQNAVGRIDRYTAYGLMAKVYLTKSGFGMKGSRNAADLQKAAEYAKIVIDKSGRKLLPNYQDIFLLKNNLNEECLLSWHWKSGREPWTMQNTLQSDLAITNFSEFADTWGGYQGPSVDLQSAFGEDALSLSRNNSDTRRKAIMMMYGDKYDHFWTDKGGFDWTAEVVKNQKNANDVGANCAKHLVGDNADHIAGNGESMYNMATGLSTHLLRLADVYLIYAEAVIGNNGSTTDAGALDAYNKVLLRARPMATPVTSITWEDVWKQRRLELALEGDRWYDYVRWHYYEPEKAIAELKGQLRSRYYGLQNYYETGTFNANDTYYDKQPTIPNVMDASFTLPFPITDLTKNPNLMKPGVDTDLSQFTY
ncbi:membrane protein [Bacteroidia bacterium]|nr:membrane protein [Bacteroidia bacterium]